MGTDERNFRSIYYEKVGFKSVEEKKSLEILLKEKCLDGNKLRQFCLRFAVPHVHRSLLWKLLLGVLPMQVDCHQFVMNQRKQEFNDLQHTLQVLKIVDGKTSKSQAFLAMWLIQTSNLTFDLNLNQEKDLSSNNFIAIVRCLMHFLDDDVDVYWIAKKFYDNLLKMKNEIPKLIDYTYYLLEKEDPEYYKLLTSNQLLDSVLLAKWFNCCFAGIFHDNCIIKIWDKICGGSYKILSYLAVYSLVLLKVRIWKMTDPVSITQCIRNITEETADTIVTKTIDMWQNYSSTKEK